MYPSITYFVLSIVFLILLGITQQSCKSERSIYNPDYTRSEFIHISLDRPTVQTVWDVNSLIKRDECLQRSFYALYTCNSGRYDEYRSRHIAFLFYTALGRLDDRVDRDNSLLICRKGCLHIEKIMINLRHLQSFSVPKIIIICK